MTTRSFRTARSFRLISGRLISRLDWAIAISIALSAAAALASSAGATAAPTAIASVSV